MKLCLSWLYTEQAYRIFFQLPIIFWGFCFGYMDALKQKILDAHDNVAKLEAQLTQKNEELMAIIKDREAVGFINVVFIDLGWGAAPIRPQKSGYIGN